MEHEYFDCPEYVASTQAEVDRAVEFECEVSKRKMLSLNSDIYTWTSISGDRITNGQTNLTLHASQMQGTLMA